jgi:hypothetical protein
MYIIIAMRLFCLNIVISFSVNGLFGLSTLIVKRLSRHKSVRLKRLVFVVLKDEFEKVR